MWISSAIRFPGKLIFELNLCYFYQHQLVPGTGIWETSTVTDFFSFLKRQILTGCMLFKRIISAHCESFQTFNWLLFYFKNWIAFQGENCRRHGTICTTWLINQSTTRLISSFSWQPTAWAEWCRRRAWTPCSLWCGSQCGRRWGWGSQPRGQSTRASPSHPPRWEGFQPVCLIRIWRIWIEFGCGAERIGIQYLC